MTVLSELCQVFLLCKWAFTVQHDSFATIDIRVYSLIKPSGSVEGGMYVPILLWFFKLLRTHCSHNRRGRGRGCGWNSWTCLKHVSPLVEKKSQGHFLTQKESAWLISGGVRGGGGWHYVFLQTGGTLLTNVWEWPTEFAVWILSVTVDYEAALQLILSRVVGTTFWVQGHFLDSTWPQPLPM